MGAAVNLLIGGPTLLYYVLFAVVSVLLEVYASYGTYSAVLKWLTLSLFAYVGTVFVVQVNWTEALKGTFIPNISLKREYLAALVAVLGTTISLISYFGSPPKKSMQAKAFYGVLTVATLINLALNFIKVDPIKALVWAAIINGIAAAPVMCFIMLLASKRTVMGKLSLPAYLKILGWAATAIMAIAAVGMFLTSRQ
jgi:Mn2+/Fe2+ NRAMP family transporter